MKLDNTENVFKLRKRDVSQGSTLGPILLIIFVIDLSLFEKSAKATSLADKTLYLWWKKK